MNRALFGYGLAVMCMTACNSATDASQSPPTESRRYQFEKDAQGRLLRLDTITGEVRVAEPPSTNTPQRAATSLAVRTSAPAPTTPRTEVPRVAVEQQRQEFGDVAKITTTGSSSTGSECPNGGKATVESERIDVFVDARSEAARMTSLPRGTEILVLESDDDWRLVRFADPAWGQRAGYIRCSQNASRGGDVSSPTTRDAGR